MYSRPAEPVNALIGHASGVAGSVGLDRRDGRWTRVKARRVRRLALGRPLRPAASTFACGPEYLWSGRVVSRAWDHRPLMRASLPLRPAFSSEPSATAPHGPLERALARAPRLLTPRRAEHPRRLRRAALPRRAGRERLVRVGRQLARSAPVSVLRRCCSRAGSPPVVCLAIGAAVLAPAVSRGDGATQLVDASCRARRSRRSSPFAVRSSVLTLRRHETAVRDRNQDLANVHEAGQRLTRPMTSDDLCREVARATRGITGAAYARLVVTSPDGRRIVLIAASGQDGESVVSGPRAPEFDARRVAWPRARERRTGPHRSRGPVGRRRAGLVPGGADLPRGPDRRRRRAARRARGGRQGGRLVHPDLPDAAVDLCGGGIGGPEGRAPRGGSRRGARGGHGRAQPIRHRERPQRGGPGDREAPHRDPGSRDHPPDDRPRAESRAGDRRRHDPDPRGRGTAGRGLGRHDRRRGPRSAQVPARRRLVRGGHRHGQGLELCRPARRAALRGVVRALRRARSTGAATSSRP